MAEFLRLLPPSEALTKLISQLGITQPKEEKIEVIRALGRITSTPIFSPELLPAFIRSTMDGYAVRSIDTFGASDNMPTYLRIVGECVMGVKPNFVIKPGQTALIHTGGMLPEGADAVVMLEYSQENRAGELEIYRSVGKNENIILSGEDVSFGQEIIPAGTRLRAAEIGGLIAVGIMDVLIVQKPRIGIISSGDEIISPEYKPQPGQVRDINSYSLSAFIEQHGGEPIRYGIVPDNEIQLKKMLSQSILDCDAVIITAGSSASTRDLTASVIQNMGLPGVLVHGVNVRPGKPTILAVCEDKAVIGLPGNPVSALVIAELFVTPVIEHLLGMKSHIRSSVLAKLTVNIPSQAGREDYIPVKLEKKIDGYSAEPIFFKSNLIFNLTQADGLGFIPADITGFSAGELITVLL